MVHVEDAARAHLYALEHPSLSGRYLCTLGSKHWNEFVTEARPYYANIAKKAPTEDAVPYSYDCSRLAATGFSFKHDFESLVRDTVDSLAKHLALG